MNSTVHGWRSTHPGFKVMAGLAIAFGLLTIKEGGMTLSGDPAAVAAAGHYVPFVLWFNFIAGFAYVIAGLGLWLRQPWAVWLAAGIAGATALACLAFALHVATGAAYEMRTAIALTLRLLVWTALAALAWRAGLQRPVSSGP